MYKVNSIVGNKRMKTLFCSMFEIKPAVTSQKSRIANIERLRVLSAFAVASFHTHDWFPRSLGVVGFVILLLTFCVFVANKPEPYDLTNVLKRKAYRLLKPWLFWSLIYGALGLVKMVYLNVPFSDVFSPIMLLIGTRIHLWFLPFAFVAALFLALIHRRIGNVPVSFNIVTATSIGALCVLGCSVIYSRLQPPTPLAQWNLGLPAIPLGFAIGRITLLQKVEDRRNLYVFVILSTAAACTAYIVLAWLYYDAWLDYGIIFAVRYCISVTVVCSALHWRGNYDPISRKLASLSYGIYLVHPLVLVFLYHLGISAQNPLVLLFVVLCISASITLILKKTPMRQFV
jgi:peptidoglycan/LPS O-acetylase OafA/YrhL